MNIYTKSIINYIGKNYDLTANLRRELFELFISSIGHSDQIYSSLDNFLKKTHPKETSVNDNSRSDERLKTISELLSSLNFKPKSILDIGAGDAKITTAVKNYYNLSKEHVYVLDEKSSSLETVTPINYVNNAINLPDNSIDLIIMYEVLHHIPPENRFIIINEAARVLSPTGFFIIREHDDDKSQDFLTFIEFVHSFWYITKNETIDPLFLISHFELIQLFNDCQLKSIKFSSYNHNNPQRLYHEVFYKIKLEQPNKLSFSNIQAENYFKNYLNKIKLSSGNERLSLIPNRFKNDLEAKYGDLSLFTENLIWKSIIIDIGIKLLLECKNSDITVEMLKDVLKI